MSVIEVEQLNNFYKFLAKSNEKSNIKELLKELEGAKEK